MCNQIGVVYTPANLADFIKHAVAIHLLLDGIFSYMDNKRTNPGVIA